MSSIRELKAEFGALEDYFPDYEIDAERRSDWAVTKDEWARAIREAEKAIARGDDATARQALDDAGRIEREWGDDPATQRHRRRLGLGR